MSNVLITVTLSTGEKIEGYVDTSSLDARESSVLVYMLATMKPEVYELWSKELDMITKRGVEDALENMKVSRQEIEELGEKLKRLITS